MESNKNYTLPNQLATKNTHSLAPVVICVSGGADSVALLHLALYSKLDIQDGNGESSIARERIAIFHLNHKLRGEAADADEAYIMELAEKYNLKCMIERRDVASLASDYGGNIENAGRELRYALAYDYAASLCRRLDVSLDDARILTAHTADDRAESFLMNAMRGSSLSGLSSIAPKADIVVRPLLHYTHEELEAYLIERDISWCIDETNKDTSYLRSYIRYKVLPPMKERMPQTALKISSVCDILTDEDDYMTQQAKEAFNACCTHADASSVGLDAGKLTSLHPAILRRVISLAIFELDNEVRQSSTAIKDVVAVLDNELGSVRIVGNIDVRIEHGCLYIRKVEDVEHLMTRLSVPGKVQFGPYEIEAQKILVDFENVDEYVREQCRAGRNKVAFIDTSLLDLSDDEDIELIVESMQTGDSIQPYGMKGRSKLVSDLLHEAHIPTHQRHLVPMIKDSKTGAIMCVGGIRTDERYSCRKTTKEFIQLSIRKG